VFHDKASGRFAYDDKHGERFPFNLHPAPSPSIAERIGERLIMSAYQASALTATPNGASPATIYPSLLQIFAQLGAALTVDSRTADDILGRIAVPFRFPVIPGDSRGMAEQV